MSDFQNQLEEEIEKRVDENIAPEASAVAPKKKLFSFKSFFMVLTLGALVLGSLAGWAWLKTEDTIAHISGNMASKTAVVERNGENIYRLSEAQPTLRMLPIEENPTKEIAKIEEIESAPIAPAPPAQTGALVSAPIPGLFQSRIEGLIPTIREKDGLTPFEAYKRPFQKQGNKPLFSVVIMDVGLSKKKTQALIENLSPEISLSFSPYAQDLKIQTDAARAQGHEVWLTLPLETKTYPMDDPGPHAILINASVEQNKSRLNRLLATTQGYAGFVAHKDHAFSREDAEVKPSIDQAFATGIAMIDSATAPRGFLGSIAFRKDYPNAKNNFWLDDDLTPIALNNKIRQAIEYGKATGGVIMMMRPYPASIKALQKFLNSAPAENFQLAPVSAQVKYGE